MPGRIEKSRGPEEDPQRKAGESDKKRKRESDSTKEIQGQSNKKKSSGLDRFLKLQQHDAEQKALSRQSSPEIATEKPKPQEPLEDATNTVKPFSVSELKPKEVNGDIKSNKERESTDSIRDRYQKENLQQQLPSVNLLFDLPHKRQDIPKPPSSDKKQN